MRAGIWMLLGGVAMGAQARVTEVMVFPGGAELQRETAVAAGATEAVFACIPARIELDSLRARGEGGVRVGEIAVRTLNPDNAPSCSGQPQLDAQIQKLQEQKADLQAERDALDLMLTLLRQNGDAKLPAAQVEAARRQALDALRQNNQLLRRQTAIDEQLRPLIAERDQRNAAVSQWHEVRVRVDAAQAGKVLLSHRTRYAGWQPVYRAELDSAGKQLRFERRAEVAQTTGESWDGVQLSLSTRQPQRASQPSQPRPWLLRERPQMEVASFAAPAPVMSAAPPPAAMKVSGSRLAVDEPLPSFQTEFDVQFRVPGATQLASGSERRSLSLERLNWPVELFTQVLPAQQTQAFLVAVLKRPAGFFPAGRVQLLRDGEAVGESHFAPGQEAEQQLGFGPDERLRVRAEPEQRDGGDKGFIGPRREMQLTRRYVLENTGKQALTVQLLEASPQSQHESIRVEAAFEPAPLAAPYRELPGVRQWQLPLAPGQQQAVTARYKLSAPKDVTVIGWP